MEMIYAEVEKEVQELAMKERFNKTVLNKSLNKGVLEEMRTEDLLNIVQSVGEESIVLVGFVLNFIGLNEVGTQK